MNADQMRQQAIQKLQSITKEVEKAQLQSACESVATEGQVETTALPPDAWLAIISLIGSIVLEIIKARNPRPTPPTP